MYNVHVKSLKTKYTHKKKGTKYKEQITKQGEEMLCAWWANLLLTVWPNLFCSWSTTGDSGMLYKPRVLIRECQHGYAAVSEILMPLPFKNNHVHELILVRIKHMQVPNSEYWVWEDFTIAFKPYIPTNISYK